MEYCENETLRQLIDAGQLHSDKELVWRLFRELVEGLEHIHSKVWMWCLSCAMLCVLAGWRSGSVLGP